MTFDFIGVGLLSGALIGIALLLLAIVERSKTSAVAGAMALAATAVAGMVAWSWSHVRGPPLWMELTEAALTLGTGLVTTGLVAHLLRSPVSRTLLASIGLIAFVAITATEARFGGDAVVYAVPLQIGCTGWSWIIYFRGLRGVGRTRTHASRQRKFAWWFLVAVSAANIGSVSRWFFPNLEWLEAVVPVTISLIFVVTILILAWQFLRHHALSLLSEGPRPSSADILLVDRAHALVAAGLFADPRLGSAVIAERLGVSASRLNAAFAASEQAGLSAMIRTVRIEKACDLLADPKERETSIDAIGLMCGFQSRSAFYQQFGRQQGMSPGEYRKRAASLS